MLQVNIIDLHFLDSEQAIASFLIETSAGPILIETGPESTFLQLEAGIKASGLQLSDIKHVFLTHIHFDHAGAAWKLAKTGAQFYVHPIGLPHLASPEKLWNSAAQIYGDQMSKLWGKMEPISRNLLTEAAHYKNFQIGNTQITALHTPGHASHHIAWKIGETLFTGDVAGVKIQNGPVVPPCPPPDINIEAWKNSISILKNQNAKNLYLTHFGKIETISDHFDSLEWILDDWANWMKPHFESQRDPKELVPEFMAYTKKKLQEKGCDEKTIQVYEYANPSWMSVTGLLRYWKLKSQGRI